MLLEIRQIHQDELEAAITLSNQTFSKSPAQKSMHVAFPYMFSKGKDNHSFGAFVNGKLVAFMGLVPFVVRIGETCVSLYALGSVCTDPAFRKQGIATKMLDRIGAFLEKTDASLLLVSGDRPLYRNADCYPFGQLYRFSYTGARFQERGSATAFSDFTVREMRKEDLLAIARLASVREVAYEQSVSDLAVLLEAKAYANSRKQEQKTIISERAGNVSSFIVLGVPGESDEDRAAIVIEWAGEAQEIVYMLDVAIEMYALEEIEIDVPWHEQDLRSMLHACPVETRKNQGTVQVVHAERLLEQLLPYVNDEKSGNSLHINLVGNGVEVITSTVAAFLSPDQFISFLFDPEPEESKVEQLQQTTNDVFPIPFPSTTGLNYT